MNYLYGKLNKELEYVKYSGEDTDTVNITVDNTDNTIKADVVRTPKTLTIHNNIYDSYDSFNGAYDTLIELPNYEIEQEDFPEGSLLIYDFKLNGEVISKIRIPYDKDIFNIELDVCVEDDKPLDGLHVGDPYLKITIEDGHGSSTYKYISLASLVYKAGDSIKIENNIISVDLDNGKLSDRLNNIVTQAQSELNAHVNDKANPHQVTQQQVGIYTYKNIDASFEEGQGNESYSCAADIKLEAIKDDTQIPNIYFSKEQVDSGNYAPYCETYYKESNANTSVVSYKTGEKFPGWYADINSKPNWDLLDWDNAKVLDDSRTCISLIEDPEATSEDPLGVIGIMKIYGDYGDWHYDKGYWYMVGSGASFIYATPPDSFPPGSGGEGVPPQYLVESNGWIQFEHFYSSSRTIGKLNYYDIWKHWIYASSNIIRTKEQLELKEDKWYIPCPWSYLPTPDGNNPFFDQEKAESFKEHIKNNPDFFNNADFTFRDEGLDGKFIRIFDITLPESTRNITKGTYGVYFVWAEGNPGVWTLYRSKVDNPTSISESEFTDYDSTELEGVKVSNIKDGFQEALGDYIHEFDSNIQKLSDNDTVNELVFNTIEGFTTDENGYSDESLFSKLDWDNADGIKDPPLADARGSYERKVIDLFNINGKVFSAIADIPSSTSTGLPKKYYLAIGSGSTASANDDKFVYECSIRISSDDYELVSDYHWNIQTYAETTPLKINNIKHQDVWGLQIGKRVAITEAGYYLKAYSKEAGKITIPAITLQ